MNSALVLDIKLEIRGLVNWSLVIQGRLDLILTTKNPLDKTEL